MFNPWTEIVIRDGNAEIERREVEPGIYLIGRGEDCDLRIDDQKVSTHHARLFVSFHDWSVTDLGSVNGTLVNDDPVGEEAVKVRPSQVIRIGDAIIELHQISEPTPEDSLMPAYKVVQRHLPPEMQGHRRYRIGKEIARGGMGAILDAVDSSTWRTVAMKVVHDASDSGVVDRFIEEAQVTAQLEHPNIVPVHELSVNEQGEVFYTMKMVRGVTLLHVLWRLREGDAVMAAKYPLAARLTLFQKVCDALAFAHSRGVIHRDLKPENIMLGDFGEVLVLDWGLARIVGSRENAAVVHSSKSDSGDSMRTLSGSVMGTPAYMSPEQARGEIEHLDARSDIYSLGAILFELLHLRPAYTGTDAMEIVMNVRLGEVEWKKAAVASGKSLPASPPPGSLLAVCTKALALNPVRRYQRVEDLQADLLAYQSGFATLAENAGMWTQLKLLVKRNKAAAIGAAAVLLVGSGFGTQAVLAGRRAERALADLRETAPTFIAQAESRIGSNDLVGALRNASAAAKLAPDRADYQLFLGHLLLAQPDLPAATVAYRRALALEPANSEAKEHLALCEELLRTESDPAKPGVGALHRIHEICMNQGRPTHALNILGQLKDERELLDSTWRAVLEKAGFITREHDGLVLLDDGTFRVALEFPTITNLNPLRGMPLSDFYINRSPITDLSPIANPLLRHVVIRFTNVTDLSPLQGLSLEFLELHAVGVSSLAPLSGMPLRRLEVLACQSVSDITPLRGMPLEYLNLESAQVKDFDVLRSLPLRFLHASHVLEKELEVLSELPVSELTISVSSMVDVSALQRMNLTSLTIQTGYVISDIAPLNGIRSLVKLRLEDCEKIESIEGLRGMSGGALALFRRAAGHPASSSGTSEPVAFPPPRRRFRMKNGFPVPPARSIILSSRGEKPPRWRFPHEFPSP